MALKASELNVGDTYSECLVEDLKRTQLVQYAGASGDYNPLHTDEPFTREIAKYPSVFAHGMLTMGMTGRMLTNYVGDARLKKYGVRFTNQVAGGYAEFHGHGEGNRRGRRRAGRQPRGGNHQSGRPGGRAGYASALVDS